MAYDGAMTVSERIERAMDWLDSDDKPQFVTVRHIRRDYTRQSNTTS